jgi:L-methionine (R)-S-oxide reductase
VMEPESLLPRLSTLPREWEQALDAAVRMLRMVPRYSWVGIYVVEGDWLVLKAWDGPRATEHVRIRVGEGVCGSAARTGRIENVPDVHKDDRYIACFPETRSEMVVPIKVDGRVVAEIDIDSDELAAFGERDEELLRRLAEALAERYPR